MVSIRRTSSSRATIAAGTSPPRVTVTIAWNGPAPLSRHASARASRWNWSQETGKAFSGIFDGAIVSCPVFVDFLESIVGWVERSETHHHQPTQTHDGYCNSSTHPTHVPTD